MCSIYKGFFPVGALILTGKASSILVSNNIANADTSGLSHPPAMTLNVREIIRSSATTPKSALGLRRFNHKHQFSVIKFEKTQTQVSCVRASPHTTPNIPTPSHCCALCEPQDKTHSIFCPGSCQCKDSKILSTNISLA